MMYVCVYCIPSSIYIRILQFIANVRLHELVDKFVKPKTVSLFLEDVSKNINWLYLHVAVVITCPCLLI